MKNLIKNIAIKIEWNKQAAIYGKNDERSMAAMKKQAACRVLYKRLNGEWPNWLLV